MVTLCVCVHMAIRGPPFKGKYEENTHTHKCTHSSSLSDAVSSDGLSFVLFLSLNNGF